MAMSLAAVAAGVIAVSAHAEEAVNAPAQAPTLRVAYELERALILPKGAYSLFKYTRHYAAVRRDGRTLLLGELFEGPSRIVIEKNEAGLPLIMDGGCSVVNVIYDVMAHEFVRVSCNGYG